MSEKCGLPIFGRHMAISHCGLEAKHEGKKCKSKELIEVEEAQKKARQAELDFSWQLKADQALPSIPVGIDLATGEIMAERD